MITSPAADSEVDVSNGLVIEWSVVPGIAEFILELENESADPEQSLSSTCRRIRRTSRSRRAGLRLAANIRWVWPPCRPAETWCLSKSSSRPPRESVLPRPCGGAVGLPGGHTEHPRVQAERRGIDQDCDQRADDTDLPQHSAQPVAPADDGGERNIRSRVGKSPPMLTEGVAALPVDQRGARDSQYEQGAKQDDRRQVAIDHQVNERPERHTPQEGMACDADYPSRRRIARELRLATHNCRARRRKPDDDE